jgi:signal-transduction protein with cAMP-binding, CBS, and nucleotidyltransferase domain
MYHVQDVMATKIVTIGEDSTVSQAAKLMSHHNIGSLIVVPEASVHNPVHEVSEVGLITERDILSKVVAHDKSTHIKVSEVASRNPHSIEASHGVPEAQELMSHNHIKYLLASQDGRLAGIVSMSDLGKVIRFCSAKGVVSSHDRDHFRHGLL